MLLATFMQPGCESLACVPGKSVDDLTLGIIRTGSEPRKVGTKTIYSPKGILGLHAVCSMRSAFIS